MKRSRKRKVRKARRSVLRAVVVWVGRRMLRRVQKQSLRSITDRPGSRRARVQVSAPLTAAFARVRRPRRATSVEAAPSFPAPASKRTRRRRAGQGFAVALLSAAAVAAIKVGVEHVIESERDEKVVTPDFDVFADDDQPE